MKGYMYILECSDGSYYTGSTNNLELRLLQHQNGEGANHTKNTGLSNLFIMSNLTGLTLPFIGRNKFKTGAGQKRKL